MDIIQYGVKYEEFEKFEKNGYNLDTHIITATAYGPTVYGPTVYALTCDKPKEEVSTNEKDFRYRWVQMSNMKLSSQKFRSLKTAIKDKAKDGFTISAWPIDKITTTYYWNFND